MSTSTAHFADNILPVTRGSALVIDLSGGVGVITDLQAAVNRPAAPLPGSGETDAAKAFWSGMYATLQAFGGDVFFYFAEDATAAIVNAPVAGLGPRQAVMISARESIDQLLPSWPALSPTGGSGAVKPPPRRYLHAIKAAGAGTTFLTMWPSSTKGG